MIESFLSLWFSQASFATSYKKGKKILKVISHKHFHSTASTGIKENSYQCVQHKTLGFLLSETKPLHEIKCNTAILAEGHGQVFLGAHNARSTNGAKETVTGLYTALLDSKQLTRYTPLSPPRGMDCCPLLLKVSCSYSFREKKWSFFFLENDGSCLTKKV